MNELDIIDKIVPHWAKDFAITMLGVQLCATSIIRWIPTPQEITWRHWKVIYKTVQRLSFHRPNWNKPKDATNAG